MITLTKVEALLKFRKLIIDPPWFFNDRKGYRKDNPEKKCTLGIGAHGNYELGTMTIEQMAPLGPLLEDVLTDDFYGFMWVCESQPTAHIDLLNAWNFARNIRSAKREIDKTEAKADLFHPSRPQKVVQWKFVNTAFVWVKTNKVNKEPFFGPGFYTAGNVERCLLFRPEKARGWHSTKGYKPSQVVMEPHPADDKGKKIHSRKPLTVHHRLDQWLDTPGLELFATQQTPGWTCLGHSVTGNLIDKDLIELASSAD